MKNIAVFAQSLTVDYALEVLKGITSFFEEKDDVCVFLTQTRFPTINEGIFEYQYWSGAEILKTKQIDAVILITSSYASYLSSQELKDFFRPFASKPIVSVSLDLEFENSVYTTVCCDQAYHDIVKHLKEVHGCKKIGFMSANLTTSTEAKERFEAYKKALADNGFEFNEDYVLDGRFTASSAREAIGKKFTSKDQIEFDSIIAANDLMAMGCSQAFSELGVKIPNELKIVGFDDTYHAKLSTPTLSTVAQQIHQQGLKAAELAYKIVNGETVPKRNVVDLYIKFRQSCGCIEAGSRRGEYKNVEGKLCPEEADAYIEKYQRHYDEINSIYTLFDTINIAGGLYKLYSTLIYLVEQMSMQNLYIYMFPESISCNRGEIITLPEEAELLMYSDLPTKSGSFKPGTKMNIQEKIISEEALGEGKGIYLLSPIFAGRENYGYMICNVRKSDFEVYNIYLKILSNIIINSLEFTKTYIKNQSLEVEKKNLIISNADLDLRAKTDELTGILNRRGFYEMGQEALNISLRMNRTGIVFFADMDGLKTINDTYGHEMGDKAICVQAEVLKRSLRSTDILGRLSGDEFAFITDGMQLEYFEGIRNKINALCKELSKENSLPFEISISIGAAVYSKDKPRLMELLVEADKNLYTEKKQKKCRSNQTEEQTSRL
ncbi:MAG: GGDEF domain-containing protein [Treponema sp.]|nr:GGDEF domain-containing protein [Treponema sp.]